MYDIEIVLEMLHHLEAHHQLEDGLIDPVDWDRFTSQDILAMACGETTVYTLTWGDDPGSDREARHQQELLRLHAWTGRTLDEAPR